MMLPPSAPGECEDFLKRKLSKGRENHRRCEGRYVLAPRNDKEMRDFLKTPAGGTGGLMAAGTKLVVTSITGGDEVYPAFPSANFAWAAALNNTDIAGVVNYDEFHTRVGLLSMAQVCRKRGLKNWPSKVQEKVINDPDELLGEGMYDLKKSVTGRVAVEMNSMKDINKALRRAKERS